uniref:Uncharacterized protein n=1 Tax=Ditylenchus dipsaci TaxID=166011 RepID=A0A915E2V3_9BILA
MFDCKGQQISVVDYYQQNYQLRLRFPRLPCIIERRPGKKEDGKSNDSYYPLEVCTIVPGQRVSINQQTPQLTEQMIRNCQALPRDFVANNKKQQENAFLTNGNPYFRSHGVRVETELTTADAEVLFPPAIVYDRNQREEPDQRGNMQWGKIGGKRFVVPAETPPVWAAVIFQNGVNGNDCNNFIGQFLDSARKKGMNAQQPTRFDEFESTDYNYIKDKLQFYKQNNCTFVMFFTKDKLDDVHHTMKLMEIELGITTQHVSNQTMVKAIGNKGAWMVIDNLLLKFNLKLGLSTAGSFANANRVQHDLMAKEWLRDTRMFIGLDMSHAAPQSLYERQANIPCKEPTIMSYTVGHPLRMRGTYWCQKSRVTHIHQLAANVKEAMMNYYAQVNRFPQHLMVFRGGVSEGEYRIVLDEEQSAFFAAFKEMEHEPGFRIPDLTMIVVQRTPITASSLRTSMHKAELLSKYYSGYRSANSLHCDCRHLQPRVSLEEVENVTYALCYSHGIVLSQFLCPLHSTLLPIWPNVGETTGSARRMRMKRGSHGSDGRAGELLPDHYFIDMSRELKPSIATKFWPERAHTLVSLNVYLPQNIQTHIFNCHIYLLLIVC